MKKVFLIFFVSMLAAATFQSCKKGENDPAISFRSRDARLIGTWNLVSVLGTWDRVEGGTHTYSTFTYDGITFLDDINTGNVGGTGTYEMTIEKSGDMSYVETLKVGNQTLIYNGAGYWEWLNTDKNKTMLSLVGGVHLFTGGDCIVDRLAYKELVIKRKYNTNDNGDTYSSDFTYTFERQ